MLPVCFLGFSMYSFIDQREREDKSWVGYVPTVQGGSLSPLPPPPSHQFHCKCPSTTNTIITISITFTSLPSLTDTFPLLKPFSIHYHHHLEHLPLLLLHRLLSHTGDGQHLEANSEHQHNGQRKDGQTLSHPKHSTGHTGAIPAAR